MELKVTKFIQIKEKDSTEMPNGQFQCEDRSLCLDLAFINLNVANKSKLPTFESINRLFSQKIFARFFQHL
jgi:hypothetical protein